MSTDLQSNPPPNVVCAAPQSAIGMATTLDDRIEIRICQRVATLSAFGAALLGLLGLIGWLTGFHVLASARTDFIPMAPLTSLLFLLSSVVLIVQVRGLANRRIRALGLAGAIVVLLLCVLKALEFGVRLPTGIEAFLVRTPSQFGVVVTGRISPITVAGFVLANATAILLFIATARSRRAPSLAAGLAAIAALGSSVVMVGYLYRTPLLYGATIIPVALPTAIGLLLLGVGWMAAAGPDTFVIRPFVGKSARARLLRAFCPLAIGIVLAEGFLQEALPFHLHLNVALVSSLTALISAIVAGLIVSRTAHSIGDALDHAEAEQRRAEEGLRESQQHIKCQFERLTALRAIDTVILSSVGLNSALQIVLDQVIGQLGADAARILLLDRQTQALTYAVGKGFRSNAITRTHLALTEGRAGLIASERSLLRVLDLEAQNEIDLFSGRLFAEEGFLEYCGLPLVAKDEVRGVLEVFHRDRAARDPDWLDFLEALAGQAAIAIDNLSLFDDLQRTGAELVTASYDSTLDGWAKALDLRDNETEGHARRVVELTLDLGRAMGLDEEQLTQVRRGALLHDIGKIGIPDSILLKPGALTDEERTIMHQHPVYAYQWLAPIPFLQPALDIPYYHHEKFDGTGYPAGLSGEQIPLSARIFSIVDVWDALRSDRPYRKAWSANRVIEHIRSLAGTHFDPQVVEAFLHIVTKNCEVPTVVMMRAA